jgi:YVTN family beta-propeller protein
MGNAVAVAAILLIAYGVWKMVAAPKVTPPLTLLAGLVLTSVGFRFDTARPLVVLTIAAAFAGALGYVFAGALRRGRQREAEDIDDPRRVASIPEVGKNPQAVALDETAATAYVVAHDSGTLAIVDLAERTVRGTVRVGKGACDVRYLPGGRVLVSVVKLRGGELVLVEPGGTVRRIAPEVSVPRGTAVSPDGAFVYVTSMDTGRLFRLDATTLDVTGSVAVGKRPVSVAVRPGGAALYVANFWSDTVSVVDAETLTETSTIAVGPQPGRLAISHTGRRLFVMCKDGLVATVDTQTQGIVAGQIGRYEGDVLAYPDDDEVCYATDPLQSELIVVNGDHGARVATLPLGGRGPVGLAAGPDGLVYLACQTGTLEIVRF